MNNFLLSPLTEGDIISASNPRSRLFQRGIASAFHSEGPPSADSPSAVSDAELSAADIHYQEQECVRPAR
jgi:hypothetical protein